MTLLAPLRGVTIRCFRETFAKEIAAAGFTEAVTPFVSAMAGVDPLKDRELRPRAGSGPLPFAVTPQLIGKDPAVLADCLRRLKDAGYPRADLNCGCPFPMVRNKGRGSGLLKNPALLERMLAAGCETMGEGNFSVKARLGVDRNDELERLLPIFNRYPLRFLAVHARNARQMYAGECDLGAFGKIAAAAKVPVVYNGDVPVPFAESKLLAALPPVPVMIGRGFVRHLGGRTDAGELLRRYCEASRSELCGDRPVLGRLKELVAYWKDLPAWRRRWNVMKLARTCDEFMSC